MNTPVNDHARSLIEPIILSSSRYTSPLSASAMLVTRPITFSATGKISAKKDSKSFFAALIATLKELNILTSGPFCSIKGE